MKRRDFIKSCAALAAAFPLRGYAFKPTANLPLPTPAQLRWQQAEIGLIYHFDLPIAAQRFAPNNTVTERLDPNLYQPTKLDTDQWLQAAVAAGARYALFTATHFNGFMQWQSDLYPYSLKQTSWRNGKADVVGMFVESCRKVGIQPGIYFSTHRNAYWNVLAHYVGGRKGHPDQPAFNRIAEKMTEELCCRYGPLFQIWYDAGVKTPAEGGPDVLPIFEKHQPDSVFYHNRQRSDIRWIGNERGKADYPCWATMPGGVVSHNAWPRPLLPTGDPEGSYWSPGMVDVPLRGSQRIHNWFWNPDQDHACHKPETLLNMYHQSVGRNCNFVIGEVITPEGLVPDSDIDVLKAFGQRVQSRYGTALAETKGNGSELTLRLEQPARIDRIVLMEEIAQGERVRAYTLEGLTGPEKWEPLGTGSCIGHKRIELFAPRELAAVRLRITEAKAEPIIKKLALFAA